jgi:hypothetical protein
MEGIAGATTGGEADDPPHPVITAKVIAADSTPVSNSQNRALCNFGVQPRRSLDSIASKRKRVLKCEKCWFLESLVTADVSRLAHVAATLMKTMKVSVPVREDARNFIDTPVSKKRHVKFTSRIMEPQQRKMTVKSVSLSNQHRPRCPPEDHVILYSPCFSLHEGRVLVTSAQGRERPCPE